MADTNITPANEITFNEICLLFEKLYKRKKQRQEQNKILMNFVNEFRLKVAKTIGKKNTTFYPILRLLLPQCERERNPYNLKETKLGRLLVNVLGLNKQSDVAQKLLNFRAVNSGSNDSDFASVAYFVLKSRIGQDASTVSVGVVNEVLHTIASAETGNKGPVLDESFSYLMKKLNAAEFKWILRIILKDLKLSMSTQRILGAFHPDAPEFFQNCNNIQKVCEEFEDGDIRPLELGVQIGYAICPMLSERMDVTDVHQLSPDKAYQVEDKFDGERFQMHMENGVFNYFSRKGFSYADNYGQTYESGLLTPYLKDCLNSNVKSVILDGEMMGWHKEKQYFGSKGYSYDIKKVTDNSSYRPCFCVFDVLYYNGRCLIGPPEKGGVTLRDRLKVLDTVFTDVVGVIQISKRKIVKDSSEVLEGLNTAIENQGEGIVVKDLDSYYIANKRNAGWYKIKPEYTEGAVTDLDLVIVGADEAENKRQGRAKSFYVACLDHAEGSERWVCVGGVASGLTFDEKERVCAFLEPNWNTSKKKPPPSDIHFNRLKPDLWILPEHSIVLQIKASELIRSTYCGAAYTLRFPRITAVRDDKPVRDVMTLDDYNRLVANSNPVEKLCTKRINESEIEQFGVKTRRTRAAKVIQVPEQFRAVPKRDVEVTSQALRGRKICVLSDDEDCKKIELINIIESHGGKHVENIGSDTWCSVAGQSSFRVRKLIASGQYDIAPTSWLRSLPKSDSPCNIAPLDMLSIKKETELQLCHMYDEYGDSYTEFTDEATLRKCFQRMDKEPPIYLTTKEKLQLDSELFGEGPNPFSYLRPCIIYSKNPLYSLLAKLRQATITDDMQYATHIVVPQEIDVKEMENKRQENAKIVTEDWLEACFESNKMVDEVDFLLTEDRNKR
ncbi:DNA ligase 4 [Aricia agestis]|uniref:DNA ligase 4 n=1 Tax=Aricia agestis TaxID=91739 RepID=UPI001C20A222|nr:DNA ligase 4 [Aricia agestis]